MDRKFRWIVGASLVLGLALAGCSSTTAPRFPQEEDDGSEDPGDDPSQAMILEDVDFAQQPIVV